MSGIPVRLLDYLDGQRVSYDTLHHREDVRARDTAADTGTPEQEFAKTVFVQVDGEYAMAVLPASHFVSPKKLQEHLPAREVRLASESQFADLCPDCEVGAAPPFGNLYGLRVYVSPALAKDEQITFNAGTHEDAIRMTYVDFEKLVQPHVVPMARHE